LRGHYTVRGDILFSFLRSREENDKESERTKNMPNRILDISAVSVSQNLTDILFKINFTESYPFKNGEALPDRDRTE
jgi:hypothetical protein